MLNKVIEILDANSEETMDPQWGIVRLFTEDAILTAAEQILTLLQPNNDCQPQLQQTPCKANVCHHCGGSNGHTIECTAWAGKTVSV